MLNFLRHYDIRSYKKGEIILQQDMEPTCALIVKEGIIKTYNITTNGEEKPIGFGTPNKLFPLGWIFGRTHKTQYYYEALTDCEVYKAPKNELLAHLHSDHSAMTSVLDQCVWEVLDHQMRINALGQSRASEKILAMIHYLALCFGRDVRQDIVEIPLPLTQQDLANLTGLTRETVSAELKKLVAKKIIFARRRKYVVLTDKLNILLDDEYEHRLVRQR